jgi:hypothetical protein
MSKSNRRKKHRVKPVEKLINYYINILKIVADGETAKSENEIFNALQALNDKGLKYKRDAIDSIHSLVGNQILNIFKNENHLQRNDVQLTPLGDKLVSWWISIDHSLTVYRNLEEIIQTNFVIEERISYVELRAKLLSKNWKLEDIPSHDERLEKAIDFMKKTLHVIILTLIKSYMRLLSKINENELAKAILNNLFLEELKKCLSLSISKQETYMGDVLTQIDLLVIPYLVEYCYNRDIHGNTLLEGKPHKLLKAICSMFEPGMDMDSNFGSLIKYIMTVKEKNVLSVPQDLPV